MADIAPAPTTEGTPSSEGDSPAYPPLVIVTREEWGASPPTGVIPLPKDMPPGFVRYTHTGDSTTCSDQESCSKELRAMQKQHMAEGAPDINYNFIIGPGGTIYEGRGWHADIELPEEFIEVQNSALDIAYMGHFKYVTPSWEMLMSAFNLLIHGIHNKYISPFLDFHHLILD